MFVWLWLAIQDPAEEVRRLQPDIDKAIDRGIDFLLRDQLRDGSWGHKADHHRNGQTALSAYTLIKSGLPATHPAVEHAFAYLAQTPPEDTYSMGCQLLAYGAAHRTDAMKPLVAELVSWMEPNGFGYPPSWVKRAEIPGLHQSQDLSATQLGALGLWAAHREGVGPSPEAWRKLMNAVFKFQEIKRWVELQEAGKTGTGKKACAGFGYYVGSAPKGSTTAAGVATLAICRDGLGSKLTGSDGNKIRDAIDIGVNWLHENWTVEKNPGDTYWLYYYLYGLERVGSLLEIETIGGHPWYLDGARELLKRQGGDGSWNEGWHPQSETCFALLFLKRATRRVATGGVEARGKIYEDRAGDVWLRGVGDSPMELSVIGFADAVKAGEMKIEKVEYLVDGAVVATVKGDKKKRWEGERHAALHAFPQRGRYSVSARVTFSDGDRGAAGFVAYVDDAFEPWMARLAASQDLIDEATARATSQNGDGQRADLAIDGLQSTYWNCGKDDAAPALAIDIGRGVRADTVILCQSRSLKSEPGHFDRITKVELVVNKERYEVDLHPFERIPTEFTLPKAENIRHLEIHVKERVPARTWKNEAGFSEVMLELRKEKPGDPTWVAQPAVNGTVRLMATEAILGWAGLEQVEHRLNVAYWNDLSPAAWEMRAKAGRYRVEIEYACDDASAGSEFEIGGLAGRVESTGGWQTYKNVEIGEIELPDGRQRLTLAPTKKPGTAVMNLRSVTLIPK